LNRDSLPSLRHYTRKRTNKQDQAVNVTTDEKAVIDAVGRNCAWFRQERGFTLDALAKRSGVSKGMLVEIEQRRTNPSIATLCRLANALNVGLSELLYQESQSARVVHHPRGKGKKFWHTAAGSRGVILDAVRVRDVGAELWRWSLAPGEKFAGTAHPQGTHEFLYVLRGVLTLEIAGETVRCSAHESLRFLADAPHVYRNASNVVCKFVMAVIEPIT
jgi:transcriptional regulator with XRE-family HTH domain